ncbi:hypothetical protein YC2023_071519 [Brassica napus]
MNQALMTYLKNPISYISSPKTSKVELSQVGGQLSTILKSLYAVIIGCHVTQNNQPITSFRLDTSHGINHILLRLGLCRQTQTTREVSMKPRADGALEGLRLCLFVFSDLDRRDRALIDQLLHNETPLLFHHSILSLCFRFISSCSSFFIYRFSLLSTNTNPTNF